MFVDVDAAGDVLLYCSSSVLLHITTHLHTSRTIIIWCKLFHLASTWNENNTNNSDKTDFSFFFFFFFFFFCLVRGFSLLASRTSSWISQFHRQLATKNNINKTFLDTQAT